MMIQRYLLRTGCILFILPALLSIGSFAFADDWEYWNGLVLEKAINERFDFTFEAEQRFRDDFSRFYFHNYSPQLYYKLNRFFTLGLDYKHEEEKNSYGKWEEENRITGVGILKWKTGGFNLKNYHKLEYRDLEAKDKWRYRLKGKVSKDMKLCSLDISPFISEEIFYDFHVYELNKNRAAAGLAFGIFKDTEVAVYFMKESCRSSVGNWSGTNILGTELAYSF